MMKLDEDLPHTVTSNHGPPSLLLHHSILLCLYGVKWNTSAQCHCLLGGYLQTCQAANGIQSIVMVLGLYRVDLDTTETEYRPIPDTGIIHSLLLRK